MPIIFQSLARSTHPVLAEDVKVRSSTAKTLFGDKLNVLQSTGTVRVCQIARAHPEK